MRVVYIGVLTVDRVIQIRSCWMTESRRLGPRTNQISTAADWMTETMLSCIACVVSVVDVFLFVLEP